MTTEGDLSAVSEKLKRNEGYVAKNPDLISDIINGKIKFISIIESLSDVLTDQDTAVRERGIDFLSWVLTEVPHDLFNSHEILAIVNFYTDRLNDHHSVAPATIKGLLALVKMKNIQKESIMQFLVPLFREMNCQTQHPTDRYNIFSIISYLVENRLEIVTDMGSDFVFGVISLADGETDPSNLLLLFKFFPLFLKSLDLGHLMEEMFDLLSCYFPIDFNSATKNNTVTREDLAEGLKNCLSARADFAEHCMSLISEKLDSSLKASKIDSYNLLAACCETFSVSDVNKRSSELWKMMQKDVLPVVDCEICDAALTALSAVVRLLSTGEPPILKTFLDDILLSIRSFVSKVDDSLFQPAMNILLAVSCNSDPAARYVLHNLRLVFVGNELLSNPSHRKVALSSLSPFLPILKESRMASSDNSDDVTTFSDISRFHLDSVAVRNIEVQKLSLEGLRHLVPDFCSNLRAEVFDIIRRLTTTNSEVRSECLTILRLLGQTAPEEVLQFLDTDFKIELNPDISGAEIGVLVAAVCVVADIPAITSYAVPRIVEVATDSMHYDVGLSNLLETCRRVESEDSDFLQTIYKDYNVTERLLTWWMKSDIKRTDAVKNLTAVVAIIVRNQESPVQQSIANTYVPILLDISCERERNIIVVEAILGSVRPNVSLDKFPNLFGKLIATAIRSDDEYTRTSSSRLLASILNKSEDAPLADVMDEISVGLSGSSPAPHRSNAARALTWIVKGLLLASSPRLESVVAEWFQLLSREDVGGDAAEGFQTVLEEEEMFLNMKSHCRIRILYRQRFFNYFPELMKMFQGSEESNRRNYLFALTQLIQGVPKHVVATEISNVVLVLAHAFDTDRPAAIASSLAVLHDLLYDQEPLLNTYVESLVPRLLRLSRYEGHMKIRMGALKCLYRYAFYPNVVTIPVRNEVIKSLEPCLDDKKRVVRSEAVLTRNRWFFVGSTTEEELFSLK